MTIVVASEVGQPRASDQNVIRWLGKNRKNKDLSSPPKKEEEEEEEVVLSIKGVKPRTESHSYPGN